VDPLFINLHRFVFGSHFVEDSRKKPVVKILKVQSKIDKPKAKKIEVKTLE
jgi:hypothetical protein